MEAPTSYESPDAVDYPTRDGRPLGETDQHRDELVTYAVGVLLEHFRDQPQVYVSGNTFVYYERGNPRAAVSPDTYVVRGVPAGLRDTFKVWEEDGRRPCFVLEITSRTTRHEDLGQKMSRYRDDLEVPEYFLFDPRAEWIPEGLRAFRRDAAGLYQRIEPGDDGRLWSEELSLGLTVVDGHLRFFPTGATTPLPTRAEAARREAERADAAEARAAALEDELRRLRAELERR